MRTLTRRILATGAVAGLLAIPAANAGAADTTTSVTLTDDGTLSISVPTGDLDNPVDLGGGAIATGASITTNGLGTVTAADTRTGLLRVTTVDTDTGLDVGTAAFCQDSDTTDTALTCSTDTVEQIPVTNAVYKFGTVTVVSGEAPATTDGVLGTATAAHASLVSGEQEFYWNPTFDIELLGTELAGTYYGVIQHSIS